ncbi:CHAT domain-containing protein [Streptomyces sp. B21-101]|uniref:CHAT domain-containing protein n=1 Tax=Streptomyces sp. B21-101 TaxID=3039415 RepID=UPI002FEEAE60
MHRLSPPSTRARKGIDRMGRDLDVHIVQNPSHDFTRSPMPTALHPDLVVALNRYDGDRIFIRLYGTAVPPSRHGDPCAVLNTRPAAVRALASRLRQRWKAEFVDARSSAEDMTLTADRPEFPYATQVDLSGEPEEELGPVLDELAVHGAYLLFGALLEGGEPPVTRVRQVLIDVLSRENLRIRFDSDVLFLPWSLLCLPEGASEGDGLDTHFGRFLGHRHQIEQTGGYYPELPDARTPAPPLTSPSVSLNHDTEVDVLGLTKAAQVAALLAKDTSFRERRSRQALVDDIAAGRLNEQFMYFWCHGLFRTDGADSPFLVVRLSDGRDIDAQTVLARCGADSGTVLRRHPLVLLNACYAGMPGSADLAHLGGALIRVGAAGVLGPQIEMPQIFAAEYALTYVERYLGGHQTAGAIAHDLARHFAGVHRNPLALAYTLHGGMDSRLERVP